MLQRFEFTFELSWKAIQEYAKYQGISVASPRESFRVAGDLELIDDVETWLEYLEERNKTAHIYDAKMARSIFEKLPRFATLVDALIAKIV
jgi:nucleotidyltransferase substrate binding protein (TIGR01987 family)